MVYSTYGEQLPLPPLLKTEDQCTVAALRWLDTMIL